MEKQIEEVKHLADLHTDLIGEMDLDQLRQDSNVVPRLEKLESQIIKIIELLEQVVKRW